MNTWFFILTLLFILVSGGMILIILVQRPQGGGLAGAFGGAGGGGTDSVFGGRVGDALTVITVIAFVVYLTLAISPNKVPIRSVQATPAQTTPAVTGADGQSFELTPIDGPPPGVTIPGTTPQSGSGATAPPGTSSDTTPATSPDTSPDNSPDNDSTESESEPPDNSDPGDME